MIRLPRTPLLAALLACLGVLGAAAVPARSAAQTCVVGPFKKITLCRVAAHGASERFSQLTAYSLFLPDWPLSVNPAVNARLWPLRNSLGQTFAWIGQNWDPALAGFNKTSGWSVYAADGKTLIDQRTLGSRSARDDPNAPYLGIQGYGCMLDSAYKSDPMVVLIHGGFGDHGQYVGVRGFLDPAAFPQTPGAISNPAVRQYSKRTARGAPTRGKTVPQALSGVHARTGCGQRDVGFAEPHKTDTSVFNRSIQGNLLDPQFAWFYRYNGKFPSHFHSARQEPYPPTVRRILTAPADNRYANYATWPFPPIDAPGGPAVTLGARLSAGRPDAQARIEASTTGMSNGGTVRAIVPLDTRYVVKDWFGYRDPNGYCGRPSDVAYEAPAAVAQWVLIAVPGTPLEGWVPRKLPFARYDSGGCGP